MSGSVKALLQKYQKRISAITGRWLKEIILYGSYARGDFRKDSDIDIMILLDLEEDSPILQEMENKIMDATYDFNWENDTDIMPIVKSARQFNYWKKAYMFYRNVDQEGVKL